MKNTEEEGGISLTCWPVEVMFRTSTVIFIKKKKKLHCNYHHSLKYLQFPGATARSNYLIITTNPKNSSLFNRAESDSTKTKQRLRRAHLVFTGLCVSGSCDGISSRKLEGHKFNIQKKLRLLLKFRQAKHWVKYVDHDRISFFREAELTLYKELSHLINLPSFIIQKQDRRWTSKKHRNKWGITERLKKKKKKETLSYCLVL